MAGNFVGGQTWNEVTVPDPNQKLFEDIPKPIPMRDRGDGDNGKKFNYDVNMALLDAEVAEKQRGKDYAKVGYSKIKSGFRR